MKVIRRIKADYESILMDRPGVVSCGIGYKVRGGKRTGDLAIVVGVVKKGLCRTENRIPYAVEGIPTDVVQMGVIRALPLPTEKWRPAPGGVSIGHPNVTAGTLGCLLKVGGEWVILSNNHILADSNRAKIGDPIIQPGTYDGGAMPDDQIATLADFVKIEFALDQIPECPTAIAVAGMLSKLAKLAGSRHYLRAYQEFPGMNLVDAAIAALLSPDDVTREVLGIGFPTGAGEAFLDDEVRSSGRTTGLTTGRVLYLDSTIQVMYPDNKIGLMTDQIGTTAMLEGGDSGSALFRGLEFVGLGFAGSTEASYHNKGYHVLKAFGATVA